MALTRINKGSFKIDLTKDLIEKGKYTDETKNVEFF